MSADRDAIDLTGGPVTEEEQCELDAILERAEREVWDATIDTLEGEATPAFRVPD